MSRDPDLSPDEARVQRLLAEARLDEPMPDDVATRLDAVIAGLGREHRSNVDQSLARARELAAARRRRTARNLLVAAAAVVAIGVGLNSVDLTVSGGDGGDAATSGAAGADDAAPGASAPESAPSAGGGDRLDEEPTTGMADKPGRGDLVELTDGAWASIVRLSSARFGTQVRSLQVQQKVAREAGAGVDSTDGLFSLGRNPLRAGCSTHGWGEGMLVPARYDGRLGAVVFRDPVGETQVVDLYLCGSDEPERSITLPVG